jgi:hypothetical protein
VPTSRAQLYAVLSNQESNTLMAADHRSWSLGTECAVLRLGRRLRTRNVAGVARTEEGARVEGKNELNPEVAVTAACAPDGKFAPFLAFLFLLQAMEEGTRTKKTVFVGGISDDVDESIIYDHFSTFGAIHFPLAQHPYSSVSQVI